ncbi:hypothetical protein GALL_473050 [mine drainage metagenome]|uniref:Uncharacterized protein n=1 Tax=mine drainage metagenome TaxID=410659 RepID=A0A1J5PTL6_9ZZZZ
MSTCATLRVTFRTPVAIGHTGQFPVLDSILLHRLALLHDGDIDAARRQMPLDRLGCGMWACGGGYDPSLIVQASPPVEIKKVYRRFVGDRDLMSLAHEHVGVPIERFPHAMTPMFGMYKPATESTYSTTHAMELEFRFRGDPDRVQRVMNLEPFLGPGHSVGMGEIGDMVIVDMGDMPDSWLVQDLHCRLTRPIPQNLPVELAVGSAWRDAVRIEAPYWQGPTMAGLRPRHAGV